MAPYEYQSLNSNTDEIRLLTLYPGRFPEEPIVSIEKVVLTENIWPQYEALSYAWGSSDNPVHLRIGTSINRTLGITQNLAIALPYLRLPERPRVLWIDAICIDQENLSERSQQVKKMKSIFQKAERVIVWLGPESNSSTLALKTLDDLASKIDINWEISVMKPASKGCPEAHWASLNDELPYDWVTWNAIYYILHHSWFERLWIWQEIRLQASDAILLCGTYAMPWQRFRTAMYCLRAKMKEPNIRGLNDRIDHIANLCDEVIIASLDTLIDRTKYCKCSDQRDRVYGVLGLIDKSEADIYIEPDYTKPVGQVYKEVALEYMKKRKNLEVLRNCGLRDKTSKMQKWMPDWAVPTSLQDWGMPSWVPNWSIPTPGNDFPYCYTTGGAYGESSCDGGGVLEVAGVAFGTVSLLDEILPIDATNTTMELLEIMQRLAPSYFKNDPYVAGGSIGEAFLRTFCCNSFNEVYLPPSSTLPNFPGVKDAFVGVLASQKEFPSSTPSALSTYLLFAHEYVIGRSLLSMQEGYIGLAPVVAQKGDQVCLILGLDAPLILRPAGKEEWLVVGRCYVHGAEDSRLLLGDLPRRYRRVIRFEQVSERWWPAYLDDQTGSVLIEDPRLGPLPPGWRRKKHDHENAWNWYIYDESGGQRDDSDKSLPGDPRWKADALRRRGVHVRNFKLV